MSEVQLGGFNVWLINTEWKDETILARWNLWLQ